jgi:hypothetical protein
MPSAEEIAAMAGMTGAAGGAFSGGTPKFSGGSFKPRGERQLYEQWQSAIAELERLKNTMQPETIAPEYRMKGATGPGNGAGMAFMAPGANGGGGEREYFIDGKWASQDAYADPEFQSLVVEPWMEKERLRKADEYQKQIAEVQQRASMYEYDYNDFLRRQQEHQQNGVGKSTYGRPQGGGGGSMGSSRR